MKYLTEVLDEINSDPKAIDNYKTDTALKILLEYAYIPEKKFDLPAGDKSHTILGAAAYFPLLNHKSLSRVWRGRQN